MSSEKIKPVLNGTAETMLQCFYARAMPGLRHLLNLKLPTSRRNAVFFCQIFLNYMLCAVVFCAIIKYEDLV